MRDMFSLDIGLRAPTRGSSSLWLSLHSTISYRKRRNYILHLYYIIYYYSIYFI